MIALRDIYLFYFSSVKGIKRFIFPIVFSCKKNPVIYNHPYFIINFTFIIFITFQQTLKNSVKLKYQVDAVEAS